MAAGEIVVSLLAKTGSFDTDIERSTKSAEKRMKAMQETASQWGAAIGVAFTAAATAGVYMAKSLIDGLDRLNDVADATGATVENISALENVALRTSNSFESVEAALIKFNMALKGTDDEGKAARALEAIGLSVEDLRRLDPAEALRQTAVGLAKFADDGDKARLVQELFGKSVREVGPFLKDLAEKTELVGTVTAEQAKQAEAFNHQLAQISKNSVDAKRALLSDLLPALNATIKAMREGGGLMGFITTGGDQTADPGAALNKINTELDRMRKLRAELDPGKSLANRINDTLFGDAADLDRQMAVLEKQKKYLQSLQASGALAGGGDVSDALSRRLGDRPSVGPLAAKPKKEPKGPQGKDLDADFRSYLDNLEKQIQKVDDLTTSEKLLDDIRRGALTVSPAQQQQLATLAARVDKEKELNEQVKEGRAREIARGEAVNKANEEYQALLQRLLDGGPAAQLEKQRKEMEMLAEAFRNGTITAEQFNDAATGALNLVGDKVPEAKSMTEELGLAFSSAFENAALGGGKLSDVFKGLLQDIARVILRLQVVEPMMKQLKEAMKSDGDSESGGGWFSMILKTVIGAWGGGGADSGVPANPYVSGARAEGGPVSGGSTYMVGERGPELFVPRTAGAIVPNHALGGGGDKITIVNQTTGRIDKVTEQRIAPGERALIIQEAVAAAWAQPNDPNSRASRTLAHNFNVRRNRS
jgi:hypothetical protein